LGALGGFDRVVSKIKINVGLTFKMVKKQMDE